MQADLFELVIFDWDGTLMDSASRIVCCLQQAAADVELKVPDDTQARQVIGLNLNDCLKQLFGQLSRQQINHYIERYRYHFYHPQAKTMNMFDGVLDGLSKLDQKGILLAVATGKGRQGLEPILNEYDLHGLFTITRCADEAFGKPHPQMLFDILEFTGINVNNAVMVGDTSYDLQMANNASMKAIAVEYGMHDASKLEQYKPIQSFSSFTQLMNWFE